MAVDVMWLGVRLGIDRVEVAAGVDRGIVDGEANAVDTGFVSGGVGMVSEDKQLARSPTEKIKKSAQVFVMCSSNSNRVGH